ncbi:hypothetical protein EsH8_IV_000284 [Colletotrichum jinshuiense]
MHDVAGCMLYFGYFHIRHTSEALKFLKALDPNTSSPNQLHDASDDTRLQLVRHADLHTNLHRNSAVGYEWSKDQESMTCEPWINKISGDLDIDFPPGWNQCRLENGQWDHIVEHINQLYMRYLPNLVTLDVTFAFKWSFKLLETWARRQKHGYASLLPNLRHLKIQLLSVEARSFDCHRILLGGVPNLATLEVHSSYSYIIPKGCRLENLRSIKFINCSMDRKSMKNVLLATPNITHFEYLSTVPGRTTSKKPLLTPQILCHILSNEFELAYTPGDKANRPAQVQLPDLHRQLRTLVIDFSPIDSDEHLRNDETIDTLQNFVKLLRLSIDSNSFTCRSQSNDCLVVNNLDELIPENLETLEITRVRDCFKELTQVALADFAFKLKDGRFKELKRIELTDCLLEHNKWGNALQALKNLFGWQGAPSLCVSGCDTEGEAVCWSC